MAPDGARNGEGTLNESLSDLLTNLTDIDLDEPTHYTYTVSSGRLSFIDRGAFTCPAWATPLFDTSFAFFC